MAIRYAVTTGNWSSTATWDGGTLPGTTDDVYANGYTVTIDQDVTVTSANTTSSGTTGARQFTYSSTEYFNCGDNTVFEVGDNDAWWSCWAMLSSNSNKFFISKINQVNDVEWGLGYLQGSGFRLIVYDPALSSTPVFDTTSLVLNRWYFIFGYHDAVNNQIGISVNGGAFTVAAHSSGVNAANAFTYVGARQSNTVDRHDGRLARLAMGKSPPGGIAASATTIRDSLFNSWRGKLYSELTTQEKTDWGLVWYADGTESSGDLIDQHGAVNGTDINTVTAARGPNNPEAGGQFIITGTLTVNANVVAGTTPCMVVSGTTDVTVNGNIFGGTASGAYGLNLGSQTATVNGNVTGGSANNARGITGGASLTIIGNVTGGSSSGHGVQSTGVSNVSITGIVTGGTQSGCAGMAVGSAANVTVTGSVVGGTTGWGVYNTSAGSVIIINGNVSGGTSSSGYGLHNQATGSLTVNGNVSGGSGGNSYGIYNFSGGDLSITGDVTGGSASGAWGVRNQNVGTVTIGGNVSAGSGSTCYGAFNESTGKILISGTVTSVGSVQGTLNNSSGTISVSGNMISSDTGYLPFSFGRVLIGDNDQDAIFKTDTGGGVVGVDRTFTTIEKYAVQTGNWSDTATWNEGILPDTFQHVYANGYTVTIDQNVTVDTVYTSAGEIAVAGGGFILNSGITLTANVIAGSTTCLTYNTSGTGFIVGNVTGGTGTYDYGVSLISGNLEVTGTVTGGSAGNAVGISNSGGNLQITGNVISGSTAAGLMVSNGDVSILGDVYASGGTGALSSYGGNSLTIQGNVLAGSPDHNDGIYIDAASAIDVQVTGNVVGGGRYSNGIVHNGTGTITINGDVTGGTGTAVPYGIEHTSAGEIIIYGTVSGGSGSSSYGIYSSGSGTVTVQGPVNGGSNNTNAGIYKSLGITNITGDITGGSATDAHGLHCAGNNIAITVNVVGNVYGGSSSAAYGIYIPACNTVNVTGNVTGTAGAGLWTNSDGSTVPVVTIIGNVSGSSSGSGVGVVNRMNGIINIVGNVYADAAIGVNACSLDGAYNGRVDVLGNIYASSTRAAIVNSYTNKVTLRGKMISSSAGVPPVATKGATAVKLFVNATNPQTLIMRSNNANNPGDARTLYTYNAFGGV